MQYGRLEIAHEVCSTTGMLKAVEKYPEAKIFIIATSSAHAIFIRFFSAFNMVEELNRCWMTYSISEPSCGLINYIICR